MRLLRVVDVCAVAPALALLLATPTVWAQSATPADPCAALPEAAPTAQGSGTAPTGGTSSAQTSQQFLRCALDQFRRQDYRRAIHFFELAHRTAPSADLVYNIARSHELMSEYEEAATAYERYLRDKVNAPDRAEVEERIRTLRDLARRRREAARQQDGRALLTIRVDVPGANVALDDRSVGASPLAPGLQVTPGSHVLRVERDGYQLWQGTIRARPGETGQADVTLAEATRFRTQPAPHVASYVLGGLGIAALGTGIALGAVAMGRPPQLLCPAGNPMCDPTLSTGTTVPHVTSYDCSRGELTCERNGLLLGSTLAISGAVALATGAVIAWFIESGSGRTERVRVTQRPTATR
jgi:hypothetical protein